MDLVEQVVCCDDQVSRGVLHSAQYTVYKNSTLALLAECGCGMAKSHSVQFIQPGGIGGPDRLRLVCSSI